MISEPSDPGEYVGECAVFLHAIKQYVNYGFWDYVCTAGVDNCCFFFKAYDVYLSIL